MVEPGVVVGDGTRVWAHAQVRVGARVGRNVVIGRNAFVDVDVIVGDNVKIQNNASLFEGVELEDGVFVGPHVIFTNDRVPRAITPNGALKDRNQWTLGTTRVRFGAAIGAGSVIVTGLTIGRWAMVGAGAVVTRNVPDHALVIGSPASIVGWVSAAGVRCDSQKEAFQLTSDEESRAQP